VTPPTALIIDEAECFAAAHHFLAGRGLRVPKDVSLVCTVDDPTFVWCEPSIAHMSWTPVPVVRRVVRWAAHVSHGQRDVRQSMTPAKFVPGGTIGPAPVAVNPKTEVG
jgi:DNA-binding LacI/PurR family transcriptional regulator